MSAEYIEFNQFKILVQRKKGLRRTRLKISPSGQIELHAPLNLKEVWVEDFLKSSENWIHKTLDKISEFKKRNPTKKYVQGETQFYLGQLLALDFRKSFNKKIKFLPSKDSLLIMIPEAQWDSSKLMTPQPWIKEPLKKFLKEEFSLLASERVEYWSNQMRLKPTSVGYRFQKTLWGSCNRQGALNLNCKLIGAPMEVIDYVIIHELAHLKHMDHSPSFWKLVEHYCANHKALREWLRRNAPHLEL